MHLPTPVAEPEAYLAASSYGLIAAVTFIVAYLLVMAEDVIKLRKSKPMVAAAGLMWVIIAVAEQHFGRGGELESRISHHLAEFCALFLFLVVAMTYISAIAGHNVFLKINAWLISAGFGYRAIFWVTGALAFVLSPIADNLTTTLVLGAVVMAVGRGDMRFVPVACVNVVIAANAGGAFSPFGDITTLMIWQAGKVPTAEFAQLLAPSLVNWLVPAVFMHFAVEKKKPAPLESDVQLKPGWAAVVGLFLATIATAIFFHGYLHLPPFLGMTTGLSYYFIYGWIRRLRHNGDSEEEPLDVFKNVADVEWDTLLFFFGVLMAVGALAEIGYLASISNWLYDGLGVFWANVSLGVLSAVVDNVPVVFAVLQMDPAMGTTPTLENYQWLLITLTAGVGGSLLSVGSAAGVGLMGVAHGQYTFTRHLKWTPVIAIGYAASVAVHYLMNAPGS